VLAEQIADVKALSSLVRRSTSVNVNDKGTKERTIALARQYFEKVRPQVVKSAATPESIAEHDSEWQHLVELAHGNNLRKSYLKTLGAINKGLSKMSMSSFAAPAGGASAGGGVHEPSREEALLISTLETLVPSAAASYRQGLADLVGNTRLSYRGTAAEFREALRETLDHLAPDKSVEGESWYKAEQGQSKPTMRQKVRFVLTSRGRNKTQRESAEKSLSLIEELSGDVMRAIYNRASLATHVQESKSEVHKIKRYVDTVMFDLLEIQSK